jgi:hypothetical protein
VAEAAQNAADRIVRPAEGQTPPLDPPASAGEFVDTAKPDVQLTPEQLEIKRLRDQLAKQEGRKDAPVVAQELANPGDEKNIVIHIREDGVTMLGKVWYRGDELEFEPGSQAYKDTFDRSGFSWLDLRDDEFGQMAKFGKVLFRSGPWPGKTYADATFESLRGLKDADGNVRPPTPEELEAAETARKKRAAPHLPAGI